MFSISSNTYHYQQQHQQQMYFGLDVAKMAESPDLSPLRNSPDDLYQQFIDKQKEFIQEQQHRQTRREERRRQIGEDLDKEEAQADAEEAEDIFEMTHQFECLTEAHLKVLRNLKSKRSLTEDDSKICKKLEVMLKEEKNTWRLAKALFKNGLFDTSACQHDDSSTRRSDLMEDSGQEVDGDAMVIAGDPSGWFSEEKHIVNYYLISSEIRRMQLVCDWLEANEADDLDYRDEEDKVEFYSEGPTAWEATFHAMRARYNIDISQLDITMNPDAGLELCPAMDPDAPIRTKKALAHSDKEVEIRLFKHLFRFIRAGKLNEGQELASRVGYFWLAASLDGCLPHSDPNLDEEILGTAVVDNPTEIRAVSGNKKWKVWKKICFKSARVYGVSSYEKAVHGVLGANLKSVLPVCDSWADQLWARLKCSIEVKIEKALRNRISQENRNFNDDYPQEFYDNYQDVENIFRSINDQRLLSPFKEATIHQTVQKHLILNDIDGLLNQLNDWCDKLDYDTNLAENDEAISPQFLRYFAHITLLLRDIKLLSPDDTRGTRIIESYIELLTQQRLIESVAHYTTFLPRDNQIVSYAKLLATIEDREERKHCLRIAKESKLEIDEITQTVVELLMSDTNTQNINETLSRSFNSSHYQFSFGIHSKESTKITAEDRKKINALDYLLYLDCKNFVAILHHGNILLRYFALQKKLEAVKEALFKLPDDLTECVEIQWRTHTNNDITLSLRNNIREFDSFRCLIDCQEELSQWSEWNLKRPEEPRKPANMSKFCDNVNYEQRLKQYQQDLSLWKNHREIKTDSLTGKISELFCFEGGWMKDLLNLDNEENGLEVNQSNSGDQQQTETVSENENNNPTLRVEQMQKLRKIYIPQMTNICFNVLQLTNRHEDCLNLSHLLASVELKLYDEFSKIQIRDFLDKISEVTKIIVKKKITES